MKKSNNREMTNSELRPLLEEVLDRIKETHPDVELTGPEISRILDYLKEKSRG